MNTYLVAYFAYQAAAVFAGQCRVLDGTAQLAMEAAMQEAENLFPGNADAKLRLEYYWPTVESLREARERTKAANEQLDKAIEASNAAFGATLPQQPRA